MYNPAYYSSWFEVEGSLVSIGFAWTVIQKASVHDKTDGYDRCGC